MIMSIKQTITFVIGPPCPVDYIQWQQTMYNLFGTKWPMLHHGPMWSVVQTGCETTITHDGSREPWKVSQHNKVRQLLLV